MSKWKEYKLNDLVTKLGDGLHGTPKYDPKGDYYFINGSNLLDGKISVNDNTKRVSKEEFDKYKKELSDRTIFVSINGTLGNIATYNNEKVILGKSACYFNVKDDVCKEFIKYIATDKSFQYYISEYATGSTIKNVPLKAIRDYTLYLPDLPTQTSIAEILSSLDDKIELNNKINQELELLAQTLFKQWFIDFEFPNENGEPYKSTGGEMVDSELGEIPKGWEVVTIDDVTETVTKGTTPTTIGVRFTEKVIIFIKVESLTESGAFIKSKFAHIDDETNLLLKRSVIKKGDVLFSIAGTIGRVAVVTNEILPANTNQAIAIIRPNKISSYFLKILMQSSLIQNDTQSNIVQAVQANLSLGIIKLTKFILPSINILSKIDIQLNNIYDNINHFVNENENLTTLRDTLLPKLISGELEINEINN